MLGSHRNKDHFPAVPNLSFHLMMSQKYEDVTVKDQFRSVRDLTL